MLGFTCIGISLHDDEQHSDSLAADAMWPFVKLLCPLVIIKCGIFGMYLHVSISSAYTLP